MREDSTDPYGASASTFRLPEPTSPASRAFRWLVNTLLGLAVASALGALNPAVTYLLLGVAVVLALGRVALTLWRGRAR